MIISQFIKKLTNPFYIDIIRFPNKDLRRRMTLWNHFEIKTILDVGANRGQYGKLSRTIGFKGTILSFEPLSLAYSKLEKEAKKDQNWHIFNFALGDTKETVSINISDNLYSSSILDITETHVSGAPQSVYKDSEEIQVDTLDAVFPTLKDKKGNIFLKIDVQGYEKNVLEGAKETLKQIKGIQIEMSLQELYKGEMLYYDMITYLGNLGFTLYSLENGFYNKETGQLLQVDGIFFRD
ncbi:MAG: FkbM family methyltransferase [Flavobacteriaceae bacterium]